MDPNLKAKLELVATAFGGGVVGYLTSHIGEGVPSTATQWEAFAFGALSMGCAAVYHRFQTAPADVSAVKAMAAKMAAGVGSALLVLIGGATVAVTTTGCAYLQSHPNLAADLQKAEDCVVPELLKDEAAGDTPLTIGVDLGSKCGPLAAEVLEDALAKTASIRSAHSKGAVLAAAKTHP